MSQFLKTLTAFGMEGMNSEEVIVEAYANSECAEERIELDNLDAIEVSMESMSDAIMEEGLGMQSLALEAAGFDFETASGFTGELSTEAVGNMVKRGYYEVKIQVKKAIQKIWKIILSVADNFLGSEGRLKSYSKLFKKYNERLAKINPKDGKDGEERGVTIRNWQENGIVENLRRFKLVSGGGDWIRVVTDGIKATDPINCVQSLIDGARRLRTAAMRIALSSGATREQISDAGRNISRITGSLTKEAAERLEREVSEQLKDADMKSALNDLIERVKEVDSDDVPILTAKTQLLSIGRALEEECRKDLKFKAQLQKLRKVWDKKTGEWDLNKLDTSDDVKDATAAILRTLNKLGPVITGLRLGLSKVYSALASNMQGVLADMAKVISKGTNIGA